MRASMFLATLLGATATLAAPSWPQKYQDFSDKFDANEAISSYFNALAKNIDSFKKGGLAAADTCDFRKAVMPTQPGLPPVSAGLVLKHVAIGRGTQNYTCDLANSTAVPVATGALATLFNASCVAASYPDVLARIPKAALSFALVPSNAVSVDGDSKLGPMALLASGKHFFTNATTPFFNLDSARWSLGHAPAHKVNASDAPADATLGLQGEKSVPWLKLLANDDATGKTKEIYRVNTAGGSPPATCTGQKPSFEVQYSAEYWFWAST